ncbi:MAG: 3-dehydroquinate synthase [Proteobacteria bacterium]|nr:3-dehydroquinate synthase [Pseudomonadota bacterium]
MAKIMVDIPPVAAQRYPILIESELLPQPLTWLPKKPYSQIVIITDNQVKKLYGLALKASLMSIGWKVGLISFAAGEATKNQQTKQSLEENMLQKGCDRQTLVLALGGGVVGDLAGFVAATFMRGIDYIQIPTSWLAMVDSSVGGKTAIDTAYGKNLIGAFWQPVSVVADMDCLKSLPKKHLINGLIEAIKMAVTFDAKGFSFIQNHLVGILAKETQLLQQVTRRAVKIKSKVVGQDPRETGLRMTLNWGHTIGHAIEKIADYQILHGYAVAYGILLEAKISEILGILPSEDYIQIADCFAQLKIHAVDIKKYPCDELLRATRSDKKNKFGLVRYVLLKKIGEVWMHEGEYAHEVADNIVRKAYKIIVDS